MFTIPSPIYGFSSPRVLDILGGQNRAPWRGQRAGPSHQRRAVDFWWISPGGFETRRNMRSDVCCMLRSPRSDGTDMGDNMGDHMGDNMGDIHAMVIW